MTHPRTRHCWVRPPNIPVEFPGLVIGWQQGDDGEWSALVSYVDKQEKVITEWIPAERLRPVKSEPTTGSAYG